MLRNRWFSGVLFVVAGVTLVCSGCARDYVTGKRTFNMMDEEAEIRVGTEEDVKIQAWLGVYDDDAVADLVTKVGQDLVGVSHRPGLKYQFRVLDTPVINAFALPGGFVYVTRGTLAHMGSIDELAGVIGHEVGHVVARHGPEQMSRSVLASGFGLFNLVGSITPLVGGIISAPSELMMRSYSRGQERESDSLGVEYSAKLGYDARELARFLKLVQQISAEEGDSIPTFLSTHPEPGERAEEVVALANEWHKKLNVEPGEIQAASYLELIDGIVFGDDPRLGYVADGVFYHPKMAFQFGIPLGWKLVNSPAAVQMSSEDGRALAVLVTTDATSLKAAAQQTVTNGKLQVISEREARLKGIEVYVVESQTKDRSARVLSYYLELGGDVLAFHGASHPRHYPTYQALLRKTLRSFQPVTDPKVLETKPMRVRIVTTKEAGTLASLAEERGIEQELHRDLARLNGRALDAPVAAGERVKILTRD